MKIKSVITAGLAAAAMLTATGCDSFLEPNLTSNNAFSAEQSTPGGNTFSKPVSGEPNVPHGGSGRVYEDSATQLSNKDDNYSVNRRSRSNTAAMGDKGWTVLVYMCGSNLESKGGAATNDLKEAVSAQFNENVHVVFQTGGSYRWQLNISPNKIQRYELRDDNLYLVDEQPQASMGDPDTLASFVEWGVKNYPAEKMGLVFWNHGGGSISGVCFDEIYNMDSLTLREIDTALNSVYDKMTDKFEFIGFDACLMSTLETANILAPYARYMYASEESEPGSGWDYTSLLNTLARDPNANGAQLGKAICDSFYQSCRAAGYADGVTLSVTDLSKLDELLVSFNATAKQVYESPYGNAIARAIYNEVDNFGGNSRFEGYTNMIDLKGFLTAAQRYAPNASDTLQKLDETMAYTRNGTQHYGAGGLAMYYPLAVQGSKELSKFSDIATSTYYLAFVDKMAYGTTGGNVDSYYNDVLFGDTDDLWSIDYSADDDVGINDDFNFAEENSTIPVTDVYFDDYGSYTVQLANSDALNYVTSAVFLEFDGVSVYLGEDDDYLISDDLLTIQDNFDGSWLSLDEVPLMIEVIDWGDDYTLYSAPILLNGEVTNLRFAFIMDTLSFEVIDTWAGIDPETGAAAKETVPLKYGDVIEPLWLAVYDYDYEYIESDMEIVYNGYNTIDYTFLGEGDLSFSMTLYDIYGNYYFTPEVGFTVEYDGSITFYPEDLENY